MGTSVKIDNKYQSLSAVCDLFVVSPYLPVAIHHRQITTIKYTRVNITMHHSFCPGYSFYVQGIMVCVDGFGRRPPTTNDRNSNHKICTIGRQ